SRRCTDGPPAPGGGNIHRSARDRNAGRESRRSRLSIVLEVPRMCGIVGYVGHRPVQDLLLHGLEKLEYRGYDSAGISMVCDGRVESVRAVGNLSALREAVDAHG